MGSQRSAIRITRDRSAKQVPTPGILHLATVGGRISSFAYRPFRGIQIRQGGGIHLSGMPAAWDQRLEEDGPPVLADVGKVIADEFRDDETGGDGSDLS
jgi:hypothetical protein